MRLLKIMSIIILLGTLAIICSCSFKGKLFFDINSDSDWESVSAIDGKSTSDIDERSISDSDFSSISDVKIGFDSSHSTDTFSKSGLSQASGSTSEVTKSESNLEMQSKLLEEIKIKYSSITPLQWGVKVDGVISDIKTDDPVVALTFDACGGGAGNGYDKELIDFLIKENVPATLFVNARWIDSNMETFLALAKNPLFEIENHGFEHKPLSVNGRSAYDIKGTTSVEEVYNEVNRNAAKIAALTGRKPLYFRSGTAFYDEIAVKIVNNLGEKPVNFTIAGDAGATYNTTQILNTAKRAQNGYILLYHMNHPEKSTAEGVMESTPMLREKGFSFVKLEDYLS